MEYFNVILTNKFGMSTVQISSLVTVKLEPSDENVFVLSNFEDICVDVDFSNTSPSTFSSTPSSPS